MSVRVSGSSRASPAATELPFAARQFGVEHRDVGRVSAGGNEHMAAAFGFATISISSSKLVAHR